MKTILTLRLLVIIMFQNIYQKNKIKDEFKNRCFQQAKIALERIQTADIEKLESSDILNLILEKLEFICPECGGKLIEKQNTTTKEQFLGCENYSSKGCKFTKNQA